MSSLPIIKPKEDVPTAMDLINMQTQWSKQINPVLDKVNEGDAIPVGTVLNWTTSIAPNKYIVCTHQTVLQSQYPELFRVITTTYNTGAEPAGSFRLPAAGGSFTLIIKAFP